MTAGAGREAYERARAAIDGGRFPEALAATEEAYRLEPEDGPIRELYVGLNLADAIKLAARARDLRRQDVLARDIGYDEEFADSDGVRDAFRRGIEAFDRVLAADPENEKALMLKAAALHRFDRAARRGEALELLRKVSEKNPANAQVRLAVRKIERECEECSDSGFCVHCAGRGERKVLGFRKKCERCWGQGICLRCGVL